ncbi:MAG: hypothetical protein ACLFQK_04820 [Fibrobacterota bacterium]
MPFTKENLSEKTVSFASQFGVDAENIVNTMNSLEKLENEGTISIKKNMVVGFDVNGPMVDPADNSLTPYPGSKEACEMLMENESIAVTLMTGWDLATMKYYQQNKLKAPVDIVCEYGQVYFKGEDVKYLYPFDESESFGFMKTVFDLMAKHGLKVAFQGNYSAGTGALVVEGDEHGDLLSHPLVDGRRPTMVQLYDAIAEGSEAEFDKDNNLILFKNDVSNLKGVHTALTRKHSLISVRVKEIPDGRIGIWIDDKDKPEFDYDKLAEFSKIAGEATGRIPQYHRDHGLDLHSKKAKEGNFSKENGLHEYAKDVFGNEDFFSLVVGDMENDIPSV